MRSDRLVKRNPLLGCAQKFPRVSWRQRSATTSLNIPTKRSAEPWSVGVPARLMERWKPFSTSKGQCLECRSDLFCSPLILERQAQEMPGALPPREAASHPGPVRQFDLEQVREDHRCQTLWFELADQMRGDLARLAWRDRCLLLAPGCNPVCVHDAPHAVLAHVQQRGECAMAQGVIDLMPCFHGHGDPRVLDRLLVARPMPNARATWLFAYTHHWSAASIRWHGLPLPQDVVLHREFPHDLFAIVRRLPCLVALTERFLFGIALVHQQARHLFLDPCLHRMRWERETPNFWQTASKVVSLCKLSSTAFAFKSVGEVFFSMMSSPFGVSPSLASSTMDWTEWGIATPG